MNQQSTATVGFNPFLTSDITDSSAPSVLPQWPVTGEKTDEQWSRKASQDAVSSQQWIPAVSRPDLESGSAVLPSWNKNDESSESDEAIGGAGTDISSNAPQQPSEIINSALQNPFGSMQQNAHGRFSWKI